MNFTMSEIVIVAACFLVIGVCFLVALIDEEGR